MAGRSVFACRAGAVSLLGAALTACGGGSDVPAGAVSEGEAAALEEAATMLDEQRAPIDAIAPPATNEDSENAPAAR